MENFYSQNNYNNMYNNNITTMKEKKSVKVSFSRTV